jgi:hypothetical protein
MISRTSQLRKSASFARPIFQSVRNTNTPDGPSFRDPGRFYLGGCGRSEAQGEEGLGFFRWPSGGGSCFLSINFSRVLFLFSGRRCRHALEGAPNWRYALRNADLHTFRRTQLIRRSHDFWLSGPLVAESTAGDIRRAQQNGECYFLLINDRSVKNLKLKTDKTF